MRELILPLLCLIGHVAFSQDIVDRTPIRLVDNFIFIDLSLNSLDKTFSFLFDTGAGVTVIDKEVAESLDITISGEININTSSVVVGTQFSDNNRVQLGQDLVLDSITLVWMSLSHLSDFLAVEVDGVIGYDLLKEVITETNIDALEMRFYASLPANPSESDQVVNLVALESDHFGVPVEVVPKGRKESIPMILKVDTGAGNALTFHNTTVEKYSLIESNRRYKTRSGFGADDTITHNLRSKVSSVVLAQTRWKNTPVVLEVDPLNESTKRVGDGLLGQDLLSDFNITYDLSKGLMHLENRK